MRLRRLDGDCESPHAIGKTIRVDDRLKGRELLETLLHEMLHAADWHKQEEWVERVSADIARVLWRPEIVARFGLVTAEVVA